MFRKYGSESVFPADVREILPDLIVYRIIWNFNNGLDTFCINESALDVAVSNLKTI